MKTKERIKLNDLPVINIEQLGQLFAELLVWYDNATFQCEEDAQEAIGEYLNQKE